MSHPICKSVLTAGLCMSLAACSGESDPDDTAAEESVVASPSTSLMIDTGHVTMPAIYGENLSLPADFPASIALPANYAVDSIVRQGQSAIVTMRAQGNYKPIFDRIQNGLKSAGWEATTSIESEDSGVMDVSKAGENIVVVIAPTTDRKDLLVSVTYGPKR